MSVSVSMPQLGESVTEGTVTRWLKKEGERVEVDEPLLEVSTDKVDTEIPSPASGILRGIAVDEDETVAVGAQLAVIEDSETSGSAPAADDSPPADAAESQPPQDAPQSSAQGQPAPAASSSGSQPNYAPPSQPAPPAPAPSAPSSQAPGYAPPPAYGTPAPAYGQPSQPGPAQPSAPSDQNGSVSASDSPGQAASDSPGQETSAPPTGGDVPYVTPLVRKLAAEHSVNLEDVTGTGVGGRIRKQDVIEASRTQRAAKPAPAAQPESPQPQSSQPAQESPAYAEAQAAQPAPAPSQHETSARPAASARPAVVPSSLRGTTQRMSRPRQVIAQRMVESLHVSAQLTTVVEADVTPIARLRDRAKGDFEAREGVKLTFLPFFALAAVEALKVHPKLNSVIDGDQVTYHDAEHVGIAVDTDRGLMVPVIHNAGDLNIGGLARKISDLAERTRSGHVGPDELAGGTFTLTNTGSRGALFDTPIINQPQVAILGTGTVVKRPVVVEDQALGEVIAVRSMVYLALTYDHRLVDGADAARFLNTVKSRLEEGAFEAELGL
jgi:pyruvate dehydrogenase E2 component (dihydrolipoamide acetyltransferase)